MGRRLGEISCRVIVSLTTLAGCGGSGPRLVPVSGTVTLDGQPLAEGQIYFKTVETGVVERFDIKDGEFTGNAQEGERRVEIGALGPKKFRDLNGMGGEVQDSLIPPRYNVESKLTATVTRDGPNKFEFKLMSK